MLTVERLAVQVRHLKTLGVDQVADAVRAHGTGLADNAVNAAYQFLARKVATLSQVGCHTRFLGLIRLTT